MMLKSFAVIASLLGLMALGSVLLGAPLPTRPVYAQQLCATPPDDMVAWWRFFENPPVEFLSGEQGTMVGGANIADGQVNSALNLDGDGDYFNAGDWDLPGTFTIDAWIFPDVLPGPGEFRAIAEKGTGTELSYALDLGPFGSLSGFVRGPAGDTWYVTPVPAVSAGSWAHVAMVYDKNAADDERIRFYVNGGEVSTTFVLGQDAGGDPNQNDAPLLVGSDGLVTKEFDGLIDELELFTRALPEAEIDAIVDAGETGKCTATIEIVKQVFNGSDSFDLLLDGFVELAGATDGSTTGPIGTTEKEPPADHEISEQGDNLENYIGQFVCSDQSGTLTGDWTINPTAPFGLTVTAGDVWLCVITNVLIPEECLGIPLNNVVLGTGGRDILRGTSANDLILGFGGDDYLYASGGGTDCVVGGEGDDRLRGDTGDELIEGNGQGVTSTPDGTNNEIGDDDDGDGDNNTGQNDSLGDNDNNVPNNDDDDDRPRRPSRR